MEEILACTNFEFQRDNCTKVKFLEGDISSLRLPDKLRRFIRRSLIEDGGVLLVEVINDGGNWMICKNGEKYPYSLKNIILLWGF